MFLDSSAIKAFKRMEVRKRSSIATKIKSRSILTCIASTGHLGISRSNFYHSFLIVPSLPPFIHAGCLGCLFCTLPSLRHPAFCVVSFLIFFQWSIFFDPRLHAELFPNMERHQSAHVLIFGVLVVSIRAPGPSILFVVVLVLCLQASCRTCHGSLNLLESPWISLNLLTPTFPSDFPIWPKPVCPPWASGLYIYIYIYVCVYIYIYLLAIYIYTFICIYIYTYIYIYIHI